MRNKTPSDRQNELESIKAEIVELLGLDQLTAEQAARFRALEARRVALQAKDLVPHGR